MFITSLCIIIHCVEFLQSLDEFIIQILLFFHRLREQMSSGVLNFLLVLTVLFIFGAQTFVGFVLRMRVELVLSQNSRFLTSQSHFVIQLLDALAVEIRLGEVNKPLRSHHTKEKSVDETYTFVPEEEKTKRNQYGIFGLLGPLSKFLSFTTF